MKKVIGFIFIMGIIALTMGLERASDDKVSYLRIQSITREPYQQRWSGDTLIFEKYDSAHSKQKFYFVP